LRQGGVNVAALGRVQGKIIYSIQNITVMKKAKRKRRRDVEENR
jgi:hypothetical protein